jgi:hypothetical protein
MRRLKTRLLGPEDEAKYKVIRMPRSEYRRYFARDSEGNYAGTEPLREWALQDLMREYGIHQEPSAPSNRLVI